MVNSMELSWFLAESTKMDLPVKYFDSSDIVQTNMGNKVSKSCFVYGTQNIVLNGQSILMRDCIIRGDMANVRIGKCCVIQSGTVIRPPYKQFSKGFTFFPIHIGDYVMVDEDCVLVGVSVGNYVHIGANSIIGRSCVIKDCCQILPNSVLMPDTVVPPFSVVGGNPARIVGELPPSTVQLMIDGTTSYYKNFLQETPAGTKSSQLPWR